MSEAARKAAASKMMRAIGIEVMHKQAYAMANLANLVQELRNEEQFTADFANGALQYLARYACGMRAGDSG